MLLKQLTKNLQEHLVNLVVLATSTKKFKCMGDGGYVVVKKKKL